MTDKTKKIIAREGLAIISILLIAVIMIGCSKVEDGSRRTVEKYSKAEFSGNYELAYSYLSKSKKMAQSEAQFKKEVEGFFHKWFTGNELVIRKLSSCCKYEIVKVLKRGNKAIVETDFRVPNIVQAAPIVQKNMFSMLSGSNEFDIDASMTKSIEQFTSQSQVPTIKPGVSYDFNLVMEDGEWKIAEIKERKNPNSASPMIKNLAHGRNDIK